MGTINHDMEHRCVVFTEVDIANNNIPEYDDFRSRNRSIIGRLPSSCENNYYDIVVKQGYYEGISIDYTEKDAESIDSVDAMVDIMRLNGQDVDVFSNSFTEQVAKDYNTDIKAIKSIRDDFIEKSGGVIDTEDIEQAYINVLDDYLSSEEEKRINDTISQIRDKYGAAEIKPGWSNTIIVPRKENYIPPEKQAMKVIWATDLSDNVFDRSGIIEYGSATYDLLKNDEDWSLDSNILTLTEQGEKFYYKWSSDDAVGYDLDNGRGYGLAERYNKHEAWQELLSNPEYSLEAKTSALLKKFLSSVEGSEYPVFLMEQDNLVTVDRKFAVPLLDAGVKEVYRTPAYSPTFTFSTEYLPAAIQKFQEEYGAYGSISASELLGEEQEQSRGRGL